MKPPQTLAMIIAEIGCEGGVSFGVVFEDELLRGVVA